MATFGEILRTHRLAAGLKQEELAERAQISVYSISNMERGVAHRPRLDTLRRLATALQLPPQEKEAFFTATNHDDKPRHALPTLPKPLTSLIGRDEERQQLNAFLQSHQHRLITVTGTAGVGKTSLALVVAADSEQSFADGAFLHWLAPLASTDALLTSLLAALGRHERGTAPLLDQVITALADRQLLLVLDNAEHLGGLPALVATLLARCPHLTLLVTSRRPLHISGEQEYAIHPFAFTPSERLATVQSEPSSLAMLWQEASVPLPLAALLAHPAVALFVQRARMITTSFAVAEQEAGIIQEICILLDGLPLAIELAAGWIRLLSVAEIWHRLQRNQHMLVQKQGNVAAHHVTLHDAWN